MEIAIVLYLIGATLAMLMHIAHIKSCKNEYLSLSDLIGCIISSMGSWITVITLGIVFLLTDGTKIVVYRFKYKENKK